MAFENYQNIKNDGLMFFKGFKTIVKNKLNSIESAKTLRKIGLFGKADLPVDFEWPKIEEVEAFECENLIKLVSFKW